MKVAEGAGPRQYRNSEELHVYERARKLTDQVHTLISASSFAKDPGLRDLDSPSHSLSIWEMDTSSYLALLFLPSGTGDWSVD